jgi:drug/metabolite transporter (DMT)-like permease
MTLMALPCLPVFLAHREPSSTSLFCSLGLVGGVSQYWTTLALYYAPPAVVSPFNYTAVIWGSGLGLFVWADLPTVPTIVGAAIVTLTGLYLLCHEASRAIRHAPVSPPRGSKSATHRVCAR